MQTALQGNCRFLGCETVCFGPLCTFGLPSGAACTPFLHVSVAVRPPGFTVLSRTALELGYAGPETGHVKTLSAVTDVITFLGRCKARVNI